ncbi:MAG: radical SAM/SPASM family putative metalloenzyme maturase [Pseudomonadota bacterium]
MDDRRRPEKTAPLPGSAASPPNPEMDPLPGTLHVEVTTRCNLRCRMCVKHADGGGIAEGDMAPAVFDAVLPILPAVERLLLNGIGEPLLHPDLDAFIRAARARMPETASIGFQTNGILLTPERARSLVTAGADRFCFSVDAVSPALYRQVRAGGEIEGVAAAFAAIGAARKAATRPISIGVEMVLRRDNLEALPDTVRWAAAHGADFFIATHMIAYDAAIQSQVAFAQDTDAAVAYFEDHRRKAAAGGIDISDYFSIRWKYSKSPEEARVVDFVDRMIADAADAGIFFHLRRLLGRDPDLSAQVSRVFADAERVATEVGVSLSLPAAAPRGEKRCEFMENASAFISWTGDVHPCFFLWHRYRCHVADWQKHVTPVSFGNLCERPFIDIWNAPDYGDFRRAVRRYEYPLCSNCSLAPCDLVDSKQFEVDCYTNTIPCCDCQWCLGVFQCLR